MQQNEKAIDAGSRVLADTKVLRALNAVLMRNSGVY